MRVILSLSAVVVSVGASAPPPQVAPPEAQQSLPSATVLTPLGNSLGVRGDPSANCRGRIETARAERGLPQLERDTAKTGEPLFIAAVDKLIDGCEVLVMRNNLSDIRPLPEFQDGPGKLTPLGGQ